MDWRKLERELINIFQAEGIELRYDNGETFVIDDDLTIRFSIGDLAKRLVERLP